MSLESRKPGIGIWIEPMSHAKKRLAEDLADARVRAEEAKEQIAWLGQLDGYVPPEELAREDGAIGDVVRLSRMNSKGQVPVRVEFALLGRTGTFEVARRIRRLRRS